MCGIVAIVRNPVVTSAPDIGDLFGPIEAAMAQVADVARDLGAADSASVLNQAAAQIGEVDRRLRPLGGIAVLVGDVALSARIAAAAVAIDASVADIEEQLARGSVDTSRLESLNAALQALKDAVWMVSRDRLRTAHEVSIFVDANGPTTALELPAIAAYASVQQALSAIDRLEVRGRDSAGIEIFVSGYSLNLTDPAIAAELAARDHLIYTSGTVRVATTGISFVYKAAAEIGELGDNTASLRDQGRAQRRRRQLRRPGFGRAPANGSTRSRPTPR
jgi:glucosamine--fructose-6-phosphate aminotransferase (isomerizing)